MSDYGYNRLQEATAALEAQRGTAGGDFQPVQDWYKVGRQVFDNRPEEFQQWAQENPEMAIRFHAVAANQSEGSQTLTPKQHQDMANAIGLAHGMSLGLGEDMKRDGKMLATDYKTFKDVNSEWGQGDFWKIGTMQTLDKGFGAFVDNLDLKDVAMMAAPFIAGPAIAPLIAGLSPAAGAAITSGLLEGIQGGDLKDILLGGGSAYIGAKLPGILESMQGGEGVFGDISGVWDKAKDIFGDIGLPDGAGDIFGDIGDIFGGIKDSAGDIFDGIFGGDFGDVPGFGDTGGEWLGELGDIIFGGGGQQPQQPSGPGMPAAGMMAPPEPAELAQLIQPQLTPLAHQLAPHQLSFTPKGMFS